MCWVVVRGMYTLITYQSIFTRAAAVFGGTIAISVFCYGVFLLGAVAHTAARTEASRNILESTTRVSALEEEYLTRMRALSPQGAHALGFVKPSLVTTVYSTAASRSLTVGLLRP